MYRSRRDTASSSMFIFLRRRSGKLSSSVPSSVSLALSPTRRRLHTWTSSLIFSSCTTSRTPSLVYLERVSASNNESVSPSVSNSSPSLLCSSSMSPHQVSCPPSASRARADLLRSAGLDGQSSFLILSFMRKLAAAGQSVLCTIHQVSCPPAAFRAQAHPFRNIALGFSLRRI